MSGQAEILYNGDNMRKISGQEEREQKVDELLTRGVVPPIPPLV